MNLVAALRSIKTFFIQLNLFESTHSRSNAHYLRTTIVATRIYIVLMTIAVCTLVTFTAFGQQTHIITIRNPSEDVFRMLYAKYSTTLQCPCEQVEIPYKTFINISYTLHPVCSSVFVSNSWIQLLFRYDMGYYFPFDFRSAGSGHFQLLASLCSFANRSVQDAIDDFLSSALLSPQSLSLTSLKAQSEAKSIFLKTSTAYTFRRLLNLVRDTTQMNSLQPAMQTSKMHLVHIYPDDRINVSALETIWPGSGNDPECFCGVTSNCYASIGFFDLYSEETQGYFVPPVDPSAMVTGFKAGCYALDGLLHSNLQCFYDATCFDTLLTYFATSNITNLDILNINQTQNSSETTIEILANDLFLELWSTEVSFSAYYSKCAPLLCVYKLPRYNSLLQTLTTLLGIYGGLTIALRICVLQIVRFWRSRKERQRNELRAIISRREHLRNAQRYVKTRLIELNLFKTSITRTDPYEEKTAIISTRIYLFVFLLALSIIIMYLLFAVRVYTVTVEKPSRIVFENLHHKYPTTLQCPCSRIVNQYELFTSLSPVFHPVCSSLYISDPWIISITDLNDIDSLYDAIDFRTAGPTFFNALATLCSLTNATIVDTWYIFGQTPLITDLTLIESEFKAQIKLAIKQFQSNTISEFNRIRSLVELHTRTMYATGYQNCLLSTNQLSNSTAPIDFALIPIETRTCSCDTDNQCTDVMSFFTYTNLTIYNPYYLNFTLSAIIISCYVVSSVLRSSLGCFFNQTCLDRVQSEIKSHRSINISILDENSTHFAPETLIGTMLENMMIETWNEEMNYDEYFEQCAPEKCVYTYATSQNLLYIVTTIVGLVGGLSVVLRITVPLIVSWIRNRIRAMRTPNTAAGRSCNNLRVRAVWHALKTHLLQFNMFKTELSWDDERRRHREILTTRIYILLLAVSVTTLVIYTLIEKQTQTVKIANPSQHQFEQFRLQAQTSATFDCPCQNILVPYQSFIFITPHFHQLCSSAFAAVNSSWIALLSSATVGIQYAYDDYRRFVVPQFRLLSSLCTLANDTVAEIILEFSRNIMISERVQSRDSIELQANSTLSQFRLSTPRTFVRTLEFILSMAQGNGILSSIASNWHFLSSDIKFEYATVWDLPYSYGDTNCSCSTNAMCISQASFNGSIVPGLHVGCYALESLLQSTLECLYNNSCIDQLKSIGHATNVRFDPLDASLSSPNITVQALLDNLLVEQWETNVIYDQYYAACAPLSCTYTFDGKISLIYTVTTTIGLFGGLSVILKLLTPSIVTIGYWVVFYRYRRVGQVVTVITVSDSNGS